MDTSAWCLDQLQVPMVSLPYQYPASRSFLFAKCMSEKLEEVTSHVVRDEATHGKRLFPMRMGPQVPNNDA